MPHCFSLFCSFTIYFSLKILFLQKNYHSTSNSILPGQLAWPGHVCSGITLMVVVGSSESDLSVSGVTEELTTRCYQQHKIPAHLESFVLPVLLVYLLNVVAHFTEQSAAQVQLLLWLHHFMFWVLSQLVCHKVGYDKGLYLFLYLVWAINFWRYSYLKPFSEGHWAAIS